VVKYVDAVEVRIVVAAVPAAAKDSVLVSHHLQILSARLVRVWPVKEIAWRQEERERRKAGAGGEVAAAAGN
jgi:hypothetical protein